MAVRRFSRFYTRRLGVLQEGVLRSPFSLAEARVLYELAHHKRTTATELGQELGLDGGYLSRILRGFQDRGLIHRQPSDADARQSLVSLTEQGHEAFARLNAASRSEVEVMLTELSEDEQHRLVGAMRAIQGLLSAQGASGRRPATPASVEPKARGLGIGKRLVQECSRFARQVGYRRITLWTNSVLHAARRICQQEGYELVREEPHHSFGHDLVGQSWELEL